MSVSARSLLTVGQIAQQTGAFESRIRRILKSRPDLVVLAGRSRCIDASDLPVVRQALGQDGAATQKESR